MATTLKPEMESRVAALAERLGFSGPDATERVVIAALDYLDESTGKWERWYTDKEIRAMQECFRAEYVTSLINANPERKSISQLLQDDLYDEFGLPK
ncbi:MAG: hypothetical protein OXL37_15990 [Chloroflexota bacterium]|nr:hypothetical protein [Chloroflexota bacterium]MDE2959845.1 hypothetical protein [Chloroflexota bacterium]